jgi:hypothetical protein
MQIRGHPLFNDIAQGSCLEGRLNEIIVAVNRQEDYLGRRTTFSQFIRSFDAVKDRH